MLKTKRPRCGACTRAKRKCSLNDGETSCAACVKRGLECVIDTVKIINYKGPSKSSMTTTLKPHNEMKNGSVTSSNLVEMLRDAAASTSASNTPKSNVSSTEEANLAVDHELHADQFLYSLSSKVYLPRQTVTEGSRGTPLLIDETEERDVDDKVEIPMSFSLADFVQSSLRVRSIRQHHHVLEAMTRTNSKSKISEKEIIQTLENNGYDVESRPKNHKVIGLYTPNFQSYDEVKIIIDTQKLSNNYYVKEPGVEVSEDHQIKIVNVGTTEIPVHVMELLFNRFCERQMSQGSYSSSSTSDNQKDVVPALQICLPLVFGNVTVLEAATVLQFLMSGELNLRQYHDAMVRLHLKILSEFQIRVQYTSTLCCDHTILLLYYLLEIEVIKGSTHPLYQHLIGITHALITFRGGPKRFKETLTGMCLFQLLMQHIVNGNPYSLSTSSVPELVQQSSATPSSSSSSSSASSLSSSFSTVTSTPAPLLCWSALQPVITNTPKISIYDNIHLTPTTSFKTSAAIYSHITQLQSLLNIVHSANTDPTVTPTASTIDAKFSYNDIPRSLLSHIISEAHTLEQTIISKSRPHKSDENSNDQPGLAELLNIKMSRLYLLQTVFCEVPISTRTIGLVSEMIETVKDAMKQFESLPQPKRKDERVYPLSLFTLGVSLVGGDNRAWLRGVIWELYEWTRRENLRTVIDLLEKIWEINPDGSRLVDTRLLAAREGVSICLFV